MAVAVAVERRALREGLPPLGKLTMWLWAWGLMMLLTLFCRAMFGTAEGIVGWVPWGGRIAKRGIHKIEQKVSNYIGGAVRPIDAHIATQWHLLAQVVRSIPSMLLDDAALIFGLAAALVVLPSVSLVKLLIRVATAPIRAAEHELEKVLGYWRQALKGLLHVVNHTIWGRLLALGLIVANVIAHELPRLGARERALERDMARLWRWVRHRKVSLTTGAFLGAFVWALGKLGLRYLRCSRSKAVQKELCSPKADLLLSLLEGGLLIVGTISIVELAKELQDEMEPAVKGITALIREQTG